MDSPSNEPFDIDGDILRHLEFEIPSPLPFTPPPTAPPTPEITRFVRNDQPDATAQADQPLDDDFTWDLDVIGPMIMALDFVDKGLKDRSGPSSSNADPGLGSSGIKEPAFQWVPPGALDCSGCNVMQGGLLQTNGIQYMRLDIHGWIGNFQHIIFYTTGCTARGDDDPGMQRFYVDLRGMTYEWVKNFMGKYHIEISEEGSVVMQNSLAAFYDALCNELDLQPSNSPAPLDLAEQSSESESDQSDESDEGDEGDEDNLPLVEASTEQDKPTEGDKDRKRKARKKQKEQREKTANLTLEDLAKLFHLPSEKATAHLQICQTTLKQICRRFNIRRWPFRKVKSVDKKLEKLEEKLKERMERGNNRAIQATRTAIRRLHERRARLYVVPPAAPTPNQ